MDHLPPEPRSEPAAGPGHPYQRPGLRELLETWTGRILIVNTLVFLAMTIEGGSLFLPSEDLLIRYGAKSSFHLIRGEYWRLVTPIFVHIGVIHYALNSLALFYIGTHIERMIGPRWFLTIYMLSGIAGGVGSAVFVMGMSAGASGAIFGLLGVGFVSERLIYRKIRQSTGERLRRGPYTGLVIVNVILGFILTSGPVRIDNGAHLGGLAAGCLLTLVMLWSTPNRLLKQRRGAAWIMVVLFTVALIVGAYLGTSKEFMRAKVDQVVASSPSPQQRYDYLSEGIRMFPKDLSLRFQRGKLLIFDGDISSALKDFSIAIENPLYMEKLDAVAQELKKEARLKEYVAVKRLLLDHEDGRPVKL